MSPGADFDLGALLHRAQAGDGVALGLLLQGYHPYLTLLARLQIGRRLQGKADASDVVQETFLEATRSFAHFRGTTEAELVAWLRQILAMNLADLVRRYVGTRRRDVRMERDLAAELDQSSRLLDRGLIGGQSTPSQEAAKREQAVRLAEALDQLPDDYREVIILRHLEGLGFAEVASRLGRTVDSVKNLWARALGRLRRSLGGDT
jgi:RNA polymerase sigma-70 factor (ECF subfamily)